MCRHRTWRANVLPVQWSSRGRDVFSVELIGIADKFLLYRFGLQVVMWQWQILRNDVVEGQSGAGMTLADAGVTLWQSLTAQHFSTTDTMTYVRLRAVTLYTWGIYTNDSDVVKHRSLLYKVAVDMQFGM